MKPHYMWTGAAANPFECAKSQVVARMVSGRFRSFTLTSHWTNGNGGFCLSPTCHAFLGSLEHILVSCPAFSETRDKLFQLLLTKSLKFPSLNETFHQVIGSNDENLITQLILEPLAFPLIRRDFYEIGEPYQHHVAYLTRTFAYNINKEYVDLLRVIKNLLSL